jgi:hypothetical protein
MQTLTDEEVKAWLAARGIQHAPYDKPGYDLVGGFYRQVPLPAGGARRQAFAEAIVKACGDFQEALLHFTDWGICTPAQMATITAILAGHGEKRPLIRVPAQAFAGGEADLLSGLLGLVINFEWSAYLYVKDGPTFLAWEGELLDIWAPLDKKREIFECLNPCLTASD